MSTRLAATALLVGLGLSGLAVACAHNAPSGFADPDGGVGVAPPKGTFADSGSSIVQEDGPECAAETQQIYVIGTDKGFYRFYPADLKFVRVGTLGCPTSAGTFSMAIDRHGVAWVEYTDGRLYAVNTLDGTCQATAFTSGQAGFTNFGMGFALNEDDAKAGERLFVAGTALGTIDTKSFDLKFIGSLTFGRTELSSIGSHLYAFSVGTGVVAELDKTNGSTVKTYRTSAIDDKAGFAFAQWGGSFWLFTGETTSTVTSYTPATDTSKVVIPDTNGIVIVGAGSSTCAPITPPK